MAEALMNPDPNQPKTRRDAMGVIFMVVVVDLLGFGLIIPLLPFYARKFDQSPLAGTLLFSIFSICQFISTPILGLISDRWGRRPVLVLSQIGSALGYVLLAWATAHQWQNLVLGLWILYASRIIDGLSGGNISTAQAYIADITTAKDRAKGMGLIGAAFGIGFSIGPAMGGMLAHYVHPAAPAWAAGFMAAVAAVLSQILLREAKPVAVSESSAWLHPRVFLPLLRNPAIVQINLLWFVAMTAFVMTDSAIAFFLSDVFGYREAKVGLYFLFVGAIIIIVQGGLIGRLSRRMGEWQLCTLGLLGVGIGSLLTAGTVHWTWVALLAFGGFVSAFGRSLFQPSISALISHQSPAEMHGANLGLFQGTGTLARVFGPVVAGMVYEAHPTWPWLAAAGVLVISSLWALGLKNRYGIQAATDKLEISVATKVTD